MLSIAEGVLNAAKTFNQTQLRMASRSACSMSQQFYHALPAVASRPVSTALKTGQHARRWPTFCKNSD